MTLDIISQHHLPCFLEIENLAWNLSSKVNELARELQRSCLTTTGIISNYHLPSFQK